MRPTARLAYRNIRFIFFPAAILTAPSIAVAALSAAALLGPSPAAAASPSGAGLAPADDVIEGEGQSSAGGASDEAPIPAPEQTIEWSSGEGLELRIDFRLVDGVRVDGTLTSWNVEGVDGSFGGRRWSAIHADDVWRVLRRVIDRENPRDWATTGRILLERSLGEQPRRSADRAEGAFRQARVLDESIEPAIEQAEAEVEAIRRSQAEAEEAAEAAKLQTLTPEAQDWPADAWPELDPQQQADAVRTMKSDATRILAATGVPLEPVETPYFLLYANIPPREAERWADQLDRTYLWLAELFGVERARNLFWGKAVVFIIDDRDRFELIEVDAFNRMADPGVEGVTHCIGPRVLINLYRNPDDAQFAAALVEEVTHGFMHRLVTPKRLPPWANEGLGGYAVSVLHRKSSADEAQRSAGLSYIREGGAVEPLLALSYEDGFPGPNAIGAHVGHLLVEFLHRQNPEAFVEWVGRVKRGEDWTEALRKAYRTPPQRIIETFIQYSKVND